jgi:hypothetical protein
MGDLVEGRRKHEAQDDCDENMPNVAITPIEADDQHPEKDKDGKKSPNDCA